MRELALFAGIGGGIYGSIILNWKTIAYVEKDAYCRAVLAQRINDGWFDKGSIYGDIEDFNRNHAHKYRGLVDVLTGGFPCQPFSVAGKREGTSDDRWLFDEIIKTIKIIQPRGLFFENVPGILGDRAIIQIYQSLNKIGYRCKPPLLLGSDDCGNIHKRQRVWIYATNTRGERGERNERKEIQGKQILQRREDIRGLADLLNRPSVPKPLVRRMADEFPDGQQQLKAIGNGQDPIVMATAYKILSETQYE